MKNYFLIYGAMAVFTLALFNSCYYDNEENLYPGGCDITDLKYTDILPIFENNCYACHGNGQRQGDIDLGSYAKLKTYADVGTLFCAINHGDGCSPMPQGSPKIDQCSIDQIEAWIKDGALEK